MKQKKMDNLDASIMDKSMRSVFVGNIPYEATEEKLKDIFGEVGQVLSFKLVFDRETGKPKGYGFCEYRDKETALSAMRNLNGYEIGGRNLRVDNACTEKSRMEMQNLMNTPPIESPYGEPLPPEQVPEAISKVVASMPPEQMFELIRQMKDCMQNNPLEARNMLLENPQLAYALLQALVIMKVLDPQTASTMLHPETAVPTLMPQIPILANSSFVSKPIPLPKPEFPVLLPMCHRFPPHQQQQPVFINHQDVDLRSLDMKGSGDPRLLPSRILGGDQDMRTISGIVPNCLPPLMPENFGRDLLRTPILGFGSDPRQSRFQDPRQKGTDKSLLRSNHVVLPNSNLPPLQNTKPLPHNTNVNRAPPNLSTSIGNPTVCDKEKTELIMQVLQLSDDQISMLPPEQRNSILVLKEQIVKTSRL